MNYIDGDLLKLAKEGKFDVIVHGANCFCTMGSGIAKQIREEFPQAYAADRKTKQGDIQKLGCFTSATANQNSSLPNDGYSQQFQIVNAYTQYNYGTDSRKADYDAIRLVMRKISHTYKGYRIGMPKIGAGLAGGDWSIIEKIIDEELKDCDVTIVNYNKKGLW